MDPPRAPQILEEAIAGSERAIGSLRGLEEPFGRAAGLLVACLRDGRKVLACGNGGSAADAAHFMTELLCRYKDDRPPLPGIALNSDGSFLTAAGNDYGFEEVFARQVGGLGDPGDLLVAITTSGNSPNITAALRTAKEKEMRSIALLGRDGGAALGIADVDLVVPADATARIQEAHGVLIHALCATVDAELFSL